MIVQPTDVFPGVENRVGETEPVDVYALIDAAREALNFDPNSSKDRYLKRPEVRRSIKEIHAILDVDSSVGNPLQFYSATVQLELISLLAQLHITFANLMTSFRKDGSIFVQYRDAAHATPRDYGQEDGNYTELSHVSQWELNDRELGQQLGNTLIDHGYESEELSSAMKTNLGALAERYSNWAWNSPEGEARKQLTTETAREKVERYLPISLLRKIGTRAAAVAGFAGATA